MVNRIPANKILNIAANVKSLWCFSADLDADD